jgi:hypothetical protein
MHVKCAGRERRGWYDHGVAPSSPHFLTTYPRRRYKFQPSCALLRSFDEFAVSRTSSFSPSILRRQ